MMSQFLEAFDEHDSELLILRFEDHTCGSEDSRNTLEQGCDVALENISVPRKQVGASQYGGGERNVPPPATQDLLF